MKHQSLSQPLKMWHEKGSLEKIQNHQIFVIDEGDIALPVVVLIHGFPTASYDFEKIWSTLKPHYRLITLDMLGFGFSEKPNQRDYTIHKQADLFSTLLKQKKIKNYHILAHDYGVSVAQELLTRDNEHEKPYQCLSCCFLNGGLFPETHQALLIQKVLLSPIGKYLNFLLGYPMFKRSFSKVFGADTKPSEHELAIFWELINVNNGRHLFHNLITYMNDRVQHRQRWLQALREAPQKLGLINGSVDPVSGAHLVVRYKELDCRLDYLKELKDIGHYPQCEAPNRVATAYLEFLQIPE
jgi:pimeloyl-ACP methyl ester carboxylesterase